MTIYEDNFGDVIDTEQVYECPVCLHRCTVKEMEFDCDCDDSDDAVCSDYCCPECLTWYGRIIDWKKV